MQPQFGEAFGGFVPGRDLQWLQDVWSSFRGMQSLRVEFYLQELSAQPLLILPIEDEETTLFGVSFGGS